ncbi:MAG: hypothetical protein AAFX07_13810 [Pseudomonadota bacterium]
MTTEASVPRVADATDQACVIVGSMIRTVAHSGNSAGFTASFYMVKQAGN